MSFWTQTGVDGIVLMIFYFVQRIQRIVKPTPSTVSEIGELILIDQGRVDLATESIPGVHGSR